MIDQIVACGGGINWAWYHWFDIDASARTAVETRADRFHRFDSWQGADDHPKADYGFDVRHMPRDDARFIETWGAATVAAWKAEWAQRLEEWKLPADTRAVLVLRPAPHVMHGLSGAFALTSLPR